MNGGRKRRIPVDVVAVSLLVLALSAVTAQQVFNGNGQPAFARQQPQFQFQQQPQFLPQNRNFAPPSASPLRHRNLFTRQISHRHRSRQRSTSSSSSSSPNIQKITHQPSSPVVVAKLTPRNNRLRTVNRSRTKPSVHANQRTSSTKSNHSRRQQFVPQQQRRQFMQPRQQFRFQQQPPSALQQTRLVRPNVPAFVRPGASRTVQFSRPQPPVLPRQPVPQFAIRAPLSPIPFGAVQRRLPQNNMRLSLRPPTPPPTPPVLTTTTPLPSSTTSLAPITTTSPSALAQHNPSQSQSLRRPIRVQQVSLDLRRKPQMTRGQFRRPHPPSSSSSSSNQQFPLIRHQPTHRVKPDRVTRPIASTASTTEIVATTPEVTTTAAATEDSRRVNHFKQVDDIEAAILQAVIESSASSTSTAPPPPSSSHRPRRIRPGHRHRTTTPSSPQVDSIEEAVLRAVLEATPSTVAPEVLTTVVSGETEEGTSSEEPTTTPKTETTSLFPAFASRRQTHRRRTTLTPTTIISTTPEATTTTSESTIISGETSSEEISTTPFSTSNTVIIEEPITTEGITTQTTEDPSQVTIAVPDEDLEEEQRPKPSEDHHQLHLIEKNVISALSTPSTSPTPPSSLSPSPSPPTSPSPAPPAPPPPFSLSPSSSSSIQIGPPGSMPPSDDIVDELNGSSDFLQVAQRLHLLRRLLQ